MYFSTTRLKNFNNMSLYKNITYISLKSSKNLKGTYCFQVPHQYKWTHHKKMVRKSQSHCSPSLVFAVVLNSYKHRIYIHIQEDKGAAQSN
jgi:hypothetical protein